MCREGFRYRKHTEEMGIQENGNGGVLKYKRMDSDAMEEDASVLCEEKRNDMNNRKYVLACAIFASLNSVLLGYGWYIVGLFCPIPLSVPPIFILILFALPLVCLSF